MKLPFHEPRSRGRESAHFDPTGNQRRLTSAATQDQGFNLIEIAICLAVIAFAILAIMGILPFGIDAQRENRNDTLINQDATYWLEAIRNGAQGLDDLTNYVERIVVGSVTNNSPYLLPGSPPPHFLDGSNIIGLITGPDTNTFTYAFAISGSAIETDPASEGRPLGFKYLMSVQLLNSLNSAEDALNPGLPLDTLQQLRLSFQYPLGPNDTPGGGRRTIRALAARNILTNDTGSGPRYFLVR